MEKSKQPSDQACLNPRLGLNTACLTVRSSLSQQLRPRVGKQFNQWLAGLVDADGHVRTYVVTISFHQNDVGVAKFIQRVLKCGYISRYKKVKACRFIISRVPALSVVAQALSNNLKGFKKHKEFMHFLVPRVGLTTSAKQSVVKPWASPHGYWFAGFAQGDGSFQIMYRKPLKPHYSGQVELVLTFEMAQKDCLLQIQQVFGGHINYRKSRHTHTYSSVNLKNAARLMVYFDAYPMVGTNLRIYLLWRKALILVLNKAHLTPAGQESIAKLKTAMSALRGYKSENQAYVVLS